MEGSRVYIKIASLRYPLRLRGRVDGYDWTLFATGDTWVFYVEDAYLGQSSCDSPWCLSGKIPGAEQMSPGLAIHIADACAHRFAKILSSEAPAIQ